MKSFKYKGTPEQMQKVAKYLQEQGVSWYDEDTSGPYLVFDSDAWDMLYAATHSSDYERDANPKMPAALELEIFGKTDKITGKVENDWIETTGDVPYTADKKIDVMFQNGDIDTGCYASDFYWDIDKQDNFYITHWRLHKSDEDYFVQPETPAYNKVDGKMEDHVTIRDSGKIVGPVKSDGGSTDYYKLTIKTKNGTFDCETGDVIAALVGDNFPLGNALKALRRIYCYSQGMGKDGIDAKYDQKKINYFVADFLERLERV
jgi:hypothetical protein